MATHTFLSFLALSNFYLFYYPLRRRTTRFHTSSIVTFYLRCLAIVKCSKPSSLIRFLKDFSGFIFVLCICYLHFSKTNFIFKQFFNYIVSSKEKKTAPSNIYSHSRNRRIFINRIKEVPE